MTLYALLLYGLMTSTGTTDSDRMRLVMDWKWRDQPDLTLVTAANTTAPVMPWGEE